MHMLLILLLHTLLLLLHLLLVFVAADKVTESQDTWQLDMTNYDSSILQGISCETYFEERMKMWKNSVHILHDICRSTSGHTLGVAHSVRMKVDHKPQLFTIVANYHVFTCNSNSILQFIALSIRVLLFMLLVIAGDVERNPGPLTDEGGCSLGTP